MGVFGFIEKFFFISFALVFVLLLLMVYHFKNRISLAEKKSESMYGLLTALVKEMKNLRSVFGLGSAATSNVPSPTIVSEPIDVKPKSQPEIDVSISPSEKNTFSSFVQNKDASNVMTFEISASDNKIVVSDMEDSDSETEEEEDEEDESSCSSDDTYSFQDESHLGQRINKQLNDVISVNDLEVEDVIDANAYVNQEFEQNDLDEDPLSSSSSQVPNEVSSEELPTTQVVETTVDVTNFLSLEGGMNLAELNVDNVLETEKPYECEVVGEKELEQSVNAEEPVESSVTEVKENTTPESTKPTMEQLKKMNINQLKAIASQYGITEDISKMKKPEIISLIMQK